jgi:hypothetical protein
MAITSCFYIYVRPIPEEGQPELPREGFGYISRQVGVMEPPSYRECVFYSGDEKEEYFDSMWRAGKAMSLMACGIGGIVMCIVLCTCCVAFQLPTFDGLFWTCMFCFVAQALTFLSWGSELCDEYECTWSSGTGMNLTAAMLWVWAGNMIKSFPEALPPRGRGRRKPVYQNDDMGDEDSPYLYPNRDERGFEDEYGEEDTWQNDGQNDGEYYDDYDDGQYEEGDEGYDDGYGDQSYDQDDPNDGYVDPYNEQENDGYIDEQDYKDPAFPNNEYATDYEEPEPEEENRLRQGKNDEFEPSPHFQDSWKGDSVDDEASFASKEGSNPFSEGTNSDAQAELSQEELQFLGEAETNDNSYSQRSIGQID